MITDLQILISEMDYIKDKILLDLRSTPRFQSLVDPEI